MLSADALRIIVTGLIDLVLFVTIVVFCFLAASRLRQAGQDVTARGYFLLGLGFTVLLVQGSVSLVAFFLQMTRHPFHIYDSAFFQAFRPIYPLGLALIAWGVITHWQAGKRQSNLEKSVGNSDDGTWPPPPTDQI